MDKEKDTLNITPPMTKDDFVKTEIFKDLNNQQAMRYGFQGEAYEKEQQIVKLKAALQEQSVELDNQAKRIAASGEIIAHVKEVCAADRDLMEFIKSRLK